MFSISSIDFRLVPLSSDVSVSSRRVETGFEFSIVDKDSQLFIVAVMFGILLDSLSEWLSFSSLFWEPSAVVWSKGLIDASGCWDSSRQRVSDAWDFSLTKEAFLEISTSNSISADSKPESIKLSVWLNAILFSSKSLSSTLSLMVSYLLVIWLLSKEVDCLCEVRGVSIIAFVRSASSLSVIFSSMAPGVEIFSVTLETISFEFGINSGSSVLVSIDSVKVWFELSPCTEPDGLTCGVSFLFSTSLCK